MDIRMQSRAVSLITRLFLANSTAAHQIPYLPQKTEIPAPSPILDPLTPPEEVGLPSERLTAFLGKLTRNREVFMHTLAVARSGRLISASAAPGYSLDVRHETHSLCKTVTGLCVGILVGEGRLSVDTPAYRLMGTGLPPILGPRMRAVTVKHLLTMSSGVIFNEIGAVTEEDWVRSFFESSVAFTPGTRFAYNSMNSYILSVIVEKISGMTLAEFAEERLFTPMGIPKTLWESCPRGHTKGGWGLYLSTADMLKIGELIRTMGTYHRHRLVPREWIREMAKPHSKVPENMGKYDYGYHIWTARDKSSVLCNGMLGQNVWVHPRHRLVVAMNAANCELFQTGPMCRIMEELFKDIPSHDPLKPNRRATAELRAAEAAFFAGRTWTHPTESHAPMRDGHIPAERWDEIAKKPYIAAKNNCGILPLFVALLHNNLPAGIRSLTLSGEGEERSVNIVEGFETYHLRVGFAHHRESEITVRGERFLVRTRAEFCDDTNGEPILKLEILFPELASVRRICFYYEGRRLSLVLSEQPGRRVLDELVAIFDYMPRSKLLGNLIRPQLEKELIAYRVRTAYEPRIVLGYGERPTEETSPLDSGAPLALDQLFPIDKPTAAPKKPTTAPKKTPKATAKKPKK